MPESSGEAFGEAATTPGPSRLFLAFLRLGATAFGGPAIVAEMRRLVVGRQRWLRPSEFDECLALSQVLPGPTAMQCAAASGQRLCGIRGAAAAFLGFGLPAVLLMLLASVVYAEALPILQAQATLRGLRIAVIAIVAWAALDFARRNVKIASDALLVALAVLLLIVSAHPVWVVVVTALIGMLRPPTGAAEQLGTAAVEPQAALPQVGLLVLAAAAVLGMLAIARPALARLGLTMMKIDVLAFGGGFAALPLMHDEFVKSQPMLSANTLLDGVALGQVTPGPVIVTATFIGYQLDGWFGAVVATAGVFFPSFALVVATAPWFRHLHRVPRFRAAVRSASLAFVGLLVAVTIQLAQSMQWTVANLLLALVCLVCLRLRVHTLWIVGGGGLLTTVLDAFAIR